jgi:hypothetical protein
MTILITIWDIFTESQANTSNLQQININGNEARKELRAMCTVQYSTKYFENIFLFIFINKSCTPEVKVLLITVT